jgi:hypothetical protein
MTDSKEEADHKETRDPASRCSAADIRNTIHQVTAECELFAEGSQDPARC